MKNFILGVLLLATLIHACTEPVSVGRDFIDDDLVDLVEVDTFTLRTSTVEVEPPIVYDSIPALATFLAGNLTDPIFGATRSEIFGEMRVAFPGIDIPDEVTVDSVVFGLSFDTLTGFGDYRTEAVDVELYRLTEDMEIRQRYRSDKTFMTEGMPIGGIYNTVPNLSENVTIYRENEDGTLDTVLLNPQFRIPIDNSIGEELLSYDSTIYNNVDEFTNLFKGVNIRINSDNSMMGFRLYNTSNNPLSSTLTVYFKEEDTISRTLTLAFRDEPGFLSSVIPSFSHNYSGSVVEPFIGDSTKGDSLLFAQGMAGPEIEVEIPYIESIEGSLVNYAELEFTVAELPDDDLETFPPVEQLTAVYESELADNVLVIDAFLAEEENPSSSFIERAFGGYVQEKTEDGVTLHHYRMKLSVQVAQMIKGNVPNKIRLRPKFKSRNADRVVIYGPGHSKYPMEFTTYLSTP